MNDLVDQTLEMVSPLSLVTVLLRVSNDFGTSLGTGTGFFYWEHGATHPFVVTNWHIVTGRKPAEPSRSNGAIPTIIEMEFHGPDQEREGYFNTASVFRSSFRINDEFGEKPLWFEHPDLGLKVDVVCIELPVHKMVQDGRRAWSTIQDYRWYADYQPEVMDEAYVIGYPWGLTGGTSALPLFKRASIASEPAVDFGNLPRFLIDCRTAGGLSGAPVVGVHRGIARERIHNGPRPIGVFRGFIGVYSGRLFMKPEASAEEQLAISEIGVVWRAHVVREIVAARRPGTKVSEMASVAI